MKIVSWNCNGAFRNKYEALVELDADLLVIQECENPALSTGKYSEWAGDYLWIGDNKNKGLGVFPRKQTALQKLDWPDDGLKSFLPCCINKSINLLAVWTMQANSPTFQYIGQLWKYLQLNKDLISCADTVICGDFNSNVIWDKWDRWWNHSDVVKELGELGIYSLYHELFAEDHGKENTPTFYLHRKQDRPYHIDYAFASRSLRNGSGFVIGDKKSWIELSDHMPIVFTVGRL